jgi:hypothetical protein
MTINTCDWNKFKANIPNHKPAYYETTKSGRPAHPMLTRYASKYNDRYVEGFGILDNNSNMLMLIILGCVLYYVYINNKKVNNLY